MRSCGSEQAGLAGRADRSGMVPAARSGARGTRRDCWPPAATCGRRGCSPPTSAASFPGTRRSNRSCGGRPIRAWCCFPRSSSLAELAQDAAQWTLHARGWIEDVRCNHRACAAPRRRSAGHLAQRRDDRVLRGAAPFGVRPLDRNLSRRTVSSAVFTAFNWAGCSSANRCSAGSAMPPRWPWPA